MVSQGAGQTRFRTLKYENKGDSNKETIVIRVIACFQPMDNCQYCIPRKDPFGLNFKSMPLDNRQQKWLPPLGLNPRACVQDTATSYPGIRFPEVGQVYASAHQFRYLQPPLLPAYDQQVSRLNRDVAPEKAIKCSQKRFLIFDQSGEKTRLLQCGFPLRFPSSTAAEAAKGFGKDPAKMLLHEDHVNDQEESEMHEDTEEINALLYSDDDDDCESDDDDDDDDEVKSTGQSPFTVEQQACNNKTTQVLDETESSDDDDDGPRRKRQKLLDHSYRDSSLSLVGTESFTKLKDLSDEKLLESNIITKQEETGSGLSDEESRKDKIHTALRILESVVPGAKGKEALLLLDEAIDYLKSLKRNLNGLINNH